MITTTYTSQIKHKFTQCEKCGNDIHSYSIFDDTYSCHTCGFYKSSTHVSFGFHFKYPNYFSITKYSADKLFYNDGTRLSKRIDKPVTYFSSPGNTRKVWNRWINENSVEIIKLAAISDEHILGCDPKIKADYNPVSYLIDSIKEQKGNYINFVILTSENKNKTRIKIGHAINYGISKCSDIYWIGGKHDAKYRMYLNSVAARNHKTCKEFLISNVYKEYVSERVPHSPAFISGPNIFNCLKMGYDQEKLDKDIYEFMTAWDNKLSKDQKLKVIINTGNTGVDTSIIRWAVENKRYIIIVNITGLTFVDKNGKSMYSTQSGATDRLMNIL